MIDVLMPFVLLCPKPPLDPERSEFGIVRVDSRQETCEVCGEPLGAHELGTWKDGSE